MSLIRSSLVVFRISEILQLFFHFIRNENSENKTGKRGKTLIIRLQGNRINLKLKKVRESRNEANAIP